MNSQDLYNLQEAYLEVYRELDEAWKPVNVPKVKSRMGNLEGRLSSVSNDRFSSNTPEYARYQRTADVVAQSTRNPNKPFQKPTPDPGGMKIKPGGGVTSSPQRNPQWQPFSSRLPTKTPATVTKPSGGGMGGARGGGSSPGSVKPAAKPSTSSSATPNPRSISGSSAPRPGRGSTSNWMTDRMGEFTSSLNRLSKPNSTTKPQVKPTKSSKGGGSTAQGVGSPSGTGRYTPGGGGRYGISGIGLADSYDLYDIILSHLLDEGYAETQEQAEVIMVNMSEEWRESIVEATVLAAKGGVAGAVQVKQTKTPGFLGTGIGSKTVSTPIPGTFTRNTPGRVQSGPRPFDAYGSGSKGAEAEMGDRSGPTDAERNRYNAAVTKNNTVGDKSVEPSPRAVNQRANQKGHSGLMPTRDNQNSTKYVKPNQSWRGY